eukprot:644075-Amphidinium_carterae.2
MWAIHTEDEVSIVHVSVGHAAPIDVEVPITWSTDEIEDAFVRHVAAKTEWIDFTWVGLDVSLEYSTHYPSLASPEGQALQDQYFAMPAARGRKRPLTNGHEVIIGHNSTRSVRLSSYTLAHQTAVRLLVSAINLLIPSAVYNAAALVQHAESPIHKDQKNDPNSDMIVIPLQVPGDAWMWVESHTGLSVERLDDERLYGAWYPYDRVLCFASAFAHKVQAPAQCSSLVLYRTERLPSPANVRMLVHLEFPLSVAELAALDNPEAEADLAEPGDAEEDLNLSSDDAEQGEQAEQVDLVENADVDVHTSDYEMLTMFKTKPDGRLRTLHLRVPPGSTVSYAVRKLKRFLHLNPAKIRITHYREDACPDDLPLWHVLAPADGPYFIRILPIVHDADTGNDEHTQQRPRAIGAPASGSRPTVAVRERTSLPPSSTTVHDVMPPSQHAAGSAAQPSVGGATLAAQSPFERWVTTKLLTIEAQQLELLIAVRELSEQRASSVSASRPEPRTPPWHRASSDITQNFVQGAGAKFHRIQHDAVAKVALTMLTKDLSSSPVVCDAKLVQHVCWNDRKCTLACFQSRCRLQRLRSFAAALRRIGLLHYHDSLIQYVQQCGKADPQHAKPEPSSEQDSELLPVLPTAQPQPQARPACLPSQCVQHGCAHTQVHTQVNTADLATRVAALEAWAHALDSASQLAPSDAATSLSKATEVIDHIARQAVAQHLQHTPEPSTDAYAALALHVDEKLDAAVAAMSGSAASPEHSAPHIPAAAVRLVPQPADGLCLYHSLAAGLADGSTAADLKRATADYIQCNHDLRVAGVPLYEWQAWESADNTTQRRDNGDAIPGHWGGAVELAAFAAQRHVLIRVFLPPSNGQDYVCAASFGHADSWHSIDLLYSGRNHYDLLVVLGSPLFHLMHVAKTTRSLDSIRASVTAVSEEQTALGPKLAALDRVHQHLTTRSLSLRGQGIPETSGICARLSAVEERLSSGRHNGDHASVQSTGTPPPFADLNAAVQPLLKSHTEAITETWKWTSSLLLAMMQQRSTNLQVHQSLIDHETQLAKISAAVTSASTVPSPCIQSAERKCEVDPADVAAPTSLTASTVESHHTADSCRPDTPSDHGGAPHHIETAEPAAQGSPLSLPQLAVPLLVCSDTDGEDE